MKYERKKNSDNGLDIGRSRHSSGREHNSPSFGSVDNRSNSWGFEELRRSRGICMRSEDDIQLKSRTSFWKMAAKNPIVCIYIILMAFSLCMIAYQSWEEGAGIGLIARPLIAFAIFLFVVFRIVFRNIRLTNSKKQNR